MITERDLQEAINECLGKRNPDSSTCIKLAAFYTIQNELYGSRQYSYASEPSPENTSDYDSGSEFSEAIRGKSLGSIMPILDDLMNTLNIIQPPLYKAVLRRLTEL